MKVTNTQLTFSSKKINTIYYNDVHSSIKHLDSFVEAHDKFCKQHKDETNLTLCGGDLFLDINSNNEIVAQKLGPITDAISAGNHDIEAGNHFFKLIEKMGLQNKFLSTNAIFTQKTTLKPLAKSTIIKRDGENFGIIGVSPLDFNNLSHSLSERKQLIDVLPLDKTIEIVKEEVKKLESQGVNKIFLLAHTGNFNKATKQDFYKDFSKIGGIDVIIGGHDHFETDRWETSERGEPVKIVATGKSDTHTFGQNLDYIGILNLEFDEKGALIKENCKNNFIKLEKSQNHSNENTIFQLSKPLIKGDSLTENTQIGNLVSDSNLWYVNTHTKGEPADFAFVNAGTIRDNFDNINVTTQDIKNVVPFTTSTLIKTTLTKDQIIKTLNWCAQSTTFGKITPGLMHVAGMEYTINPDLSISNVHILNNDGSIKYKLDDFNADHKFNVAYDVFLATGVAGLTEMKKDIYNDKNIEIFEASRQDALLEYLTKCPKIYDFEKERIHQTKPVATSIK